MNAHRRLLPVLCAVVFLGVVGALVYRGHSRLEDSHLKRRNNGLQIVSLSPSATEMLFALGVGDSIVGATDWCDYPPEAKQIKRVGGMGGPNLEVLLGLSPDIVIATDFEREDIKRLLEKSNIQVLETQIHTIDELFNAFRQIGRAVGRSEQAEQCVAQMQAKLQAVSANLATVPESSRPRVFFELWDDPLTTVGGGSFVDDVIARAGGVNVAHDVPMAHPTINPEKVIEWNPDVMIVVSHKNRATPSAEELSKRIGWTGIAAVKNGHVLCDIPDDLVLRPGPRLIDGIELLSKRLYETATNNQAR